MGADVEEAWPRAECLGMGGGQGVRVDHGQGGTCVMGVAGSGVTSQAVALRGFRTLGQQEGPTVGSSGGS